jgi:glycosyltransferase involved in cell wall biosynthesis
MRKLGMEMDKVIYHGIDLERFKPVDKDTKKELRAKYGINNQKPVGLWIGRFHPQKGWHILRELALKRPDVMWLVMMSGNVDRKARLPNVRILPKIPFNHMQEIYQMADFYIMTSCVESFSLTTLEAMATNLPVFAYNTGIVWDINNGHVKSFPGLNVIEQWNADAFLKALPENEKLYNLPSETRKIAEQFPIEKWRTEWKEIIDEVKSSGKQSN